jgi:hypothetical protein
LAASLVSPWVASSAVPSVTSLAIIASSLAAVASSWVAAAAFDTEVVAAEASGQEEGVILLILCSPFSDLLCFCIYILYMYIQN